MKSPIPRRTLAVNGLLGVLLVGGAGYGYASLNSSGGGSTTSGQPVAARQETLTESVSASGSVASANTQSLSFGAAGTVSAIEAKVGDQVHKGDVLARLDTTEAQENLNVAAAQLTAAQASYAKATSSDSAQLYSSLVSAQNGYHDAQRTLAGTKIIAPFTGTVIAVNGNVGGSSSGSSSSSASGSSSSSSAARSGSTGSTSGTASSGSTSSGFITLSDPRHLEVTADFTEADTTKIKTGQTANITFSALSGVTATGKVAEIDSSPTTNNNVVDYGVTVTMDSPPKGVRLGQTSSVQVIVQQVQNALVVPTAAVRTAAGASTVTVVGADGKRATRTVQVGLVGDSGTQVTSGLTAGEQVLLATTTGTTGSTGGTTTGGAGGLGGGLGGGGFGGGFGGGRG